MVASSKRTLEDPSKTCQKKPGAMASMGEG
jgi:hypothetical protein